LLAAAMLVPLAERLLGWPVHTPLGVPLGVHLTVLAAVGGLATLANLRRAGAAPWQLAVRAVVVAVLALALARIVRERANVFYTASALVDGMAVLFLARVGVALLQGWAVARAMPATPAVRLSHALVAIVGWLLAASWVLIALEHRHVVGPMLLLAGAFEVVALVVLIPEASAGPGWLARLRGVRAPKGRHSRWLPLDRHAPAPHARAVAPVFRRSS
jgi:hypothetical protein